MKKSQSSDYLGKLEKAIEADQGGNLTVGNSLEVDGDLSVNDSVDGIYLGVEQTNLFVNEGSFNISIENGSFSYTFTSDAGLIGNDDHNYEQFSIGKDGINCIGYEDGQGNTNASITLTPGFLLTAECNENNTICTFDFGQGNAHLIFNNYIKEDYTEIVLENSKSDLDTIVLRSKLYRHTLTLNDSIYWEFITYGKGLVADSLQDLTNITNASSGSKFVVDRSTIATYDGGVWKVGDTTITSVADVVTPM